MNLSYATGVWCAWQPPSHNANCFFNLRSMRKSLAALSPKEAQAIADDLGVKLSEVMEMEQRMTGKDVGLLADNSDDDDNFAPTIGLPTTTTSLPNKLPKSPLCSNRRFTKCLSPIRRAQSPHCGKPLATR